MSSSTGVPTSSQHSNEQAAPRTNAGLWVAVLGGPAVWLFHFEAIFALAPWACISQAKAGLYAVSVAALTMTLSNAFFSFRLWRAFGQEWPGNAGGPGGRARLMAIGGLFLNIGFSVVIVAQALPELILGACE